jgi:nucleotide-binding universal stress UspA family protein
MAYKTLLVYVDPGPGAQKRLEAAASIAAHFEATIIGVAAAMLRPFTDPYGYPVVSSVIGSELRDKQHRIVAELEACEAVFRRWAGAAGVPWEWREDAQFAVDLIVVGAQQSDDASDFRPIDIGALLLRSGRPALCLRPQTSWTGATRVVVAWKDTREARRAIADALPLLRVAEQVAVVEIVEPGTRSDESVKAAGAFLARHGVRVVTQSEPQRETSIEEQLFRHVNGGAGDLIVAGGYGHSRLGEWVFGGVTNALINDSPVPVLLSH